MSATATGLFIAEGALDATASLPAFVASAADPSMRLPVRRGRA